MRARTALLLLAASSAAACSDPAPSPAPGPAPAGAGAPAAAAPSPVRFEEVALKAGLDFQMTFLRPEQGENFKINLYDHGTGVSVADIDGDGREDIYLVNQLGPNGMFRSRGDGTFEDVTAASGAGLDGLIGVGAVFADVDADGDQDLYVTTSRGGNVYLENDGKGVFRDVTRKAGLALVAESMSPSFFDADGDGDLDLLVTNTARWTLESFDDKLRYYRGKATLDELIDSEKQENAFYLNDGKGKFTEAAGPAGLKGKGWGGDAAVFDMDDDGDLDVFICNMFGSSVLHENDGKGRFKDVTAAVLGKTSWGAVGCRAFDYDGDGLLDLFVSDMHSDMWIPFDLDPALVEPGERYPSFYAKAVKMGAATAEQDREFALKASATPGEVIFGSTLFRNLGGGKFEEVAQKAGWETFWPWGVTEGDYDADGYPDIYVPSGMGYPLFHWPSAVLRNSGKGTFQDIARAAGVEPPPGGPQMGIVFKGKAAVRSSRSAATLDFDGDGRLDVVVNNFNDRCWLWRNVSPEGTWCRIRLKETRGHRDAIGALVRLTAGGRTRTMMVQAAGGYLAQSSNILHFGLGGAKTVEKVEIRWPGGNLQTVTDVKAGEVNVITEPKE